MAAAPPTPHDALFRGVFGDREHAFAHLRTLLPDAVARALEPGSLEPLAETFVDGRLAERQCDLLYRVRLAGEQALLYLLLEHLSRVDPRMPVRLLRYLARIPDGRLAGVALVRLILLLLKHGRDPDLFARLAGWADLFREVLRRQGWHSLDLVLECVVGVAEVPGETLAGFFRSQVDHHAGEAIMTLAEQMRQQGRAEGWQQGGRRADRRASGASWSGCSSSTSARSPRRSSGGSTWPARTSWTPGPKCCWSRAHRRRWSPRRLHDLPRSAEMTLPAAQQAVSEATPAHRTASSGLAGAGSGPMVVASAPIPGLWSYPTPRCKIGRAHV